MVRSSVGVGHVVVEGVRPTMTVQRSVVLEGVRPVTRDPWWYREYDVYENQVRVIGVGRPDRKCRRTRGGGWGSDLTSPC